jgi:2,4-dienoyl-CoA reductase-like NADH-dependent reductase (Old Yellow Enzyme family)
MTDLFESLTFRTGLRASNRVVLAPMTNKQSHADGSLSDTERDWLFSRAEGGFGTVMTCAAHVAKDGQGWPGELGVFDDSLLPGLSRLAAGLRARGAVSIVQIFHGGLRADPAVSGVTPWSASPADGVREATADDLSRIVGQFAAAARRAQAAGFDGVELHGAHGYLFTQFLSAVQNRRTDEWGGALENRARLLRQATRAVRDAVGAAFTVGVRLSPEDFGNARGLDLDESLLVARWLADDGVDFLHLSLWQALRPSTKRPDQHALPLFRAVLPRDVTVLAAGAIWTLEEADQVLALGADGVVLGRPALIKRDCPLRAREHGWEPRRPPVSVEDLRAAGLGPAFAEYMKSWKGFVI